MTNNLLGEVYLKIIEEVAISSTGDFEESGVSQTVLQALQQEWQAKLSQRNVAHMPWDPKPVQQSPAPPPSVALPNNVGANGVPPSAYTSYTAQAPSTVTAGGPRVKSEPGSEPQYTAAPNGYTANAGQPQGGIARAQQLVQAQYGQAASASLNAMQRGLALPGQQPPSTKPQGLQLPQNVANVQQQFAIQQQQAMQRGQQHIQQQQQQQHQQQSQPQPKTETTSSPGVRQGSFQQPALPNYNQTDGADDVDDANDALEQWKQRLAETRAIHQVHGKHADHLIRQHVMQAGAEMRSGLMIPLDEQPSVRGRKRKATEPRSLSPMNADKVVQAGISIPQFDGELDDDDKSDVKDEDDENAINSDLDDSDSDGKGVAGEDDEEFGDEILCTYDKVQRVKNKWKCTLKDGVMAANGKDWVFHKGMGEFEW